MKICLCLCTVLLFSTFTSGQTYVNDFEDGNLLPYERTTPCADKVDPCECGDGLSVKHSTLRARSGRGSAYFRLLPCHEKADVTFNYPGSMKDNWLGFSVYIPTDLPADFGSDQPLHTLWQLHDTHEQSQCAGIRSQGPLKFTVNKKREIIIHMRTKRPGENCNEYTILKVDYPFADMLGKWTDIVVNIRSSTESDGYLKIWMGAAGIQTDTVLDYSGSTWSLNGNGPAFRFGPYTGNPRGSGSTWEFWFDEYRYGVGVGYDAVAPPVEVGARGPSTGFSVFPNPGNGRFRIRRGQAGAGSYRGRQRKGGACRKA